MIEKNSSEFVCSPNMPCNHNTNHSTGLVHLIFLPPKFIYPNIQKFLKYHSDVSEHSGFSELTQEYSEEHSSEEQT
jgi:hypothetical protein